MPIPTNINRNHILQAMLKIDKETVPHKRKVKKYFVEHEKKIYPCKLLISWANICANGAELDCDPRIFQSQSATSFLKQLGFTISVSKNKL